LAGTAARKQARSDLTGHVRAYIARMQTVQELKTIGDDELLRRLAALLAAFRHSEADLVAHIGDVDARRLYVRQAAPSMFVYCTERLHLSEAEACLRIAAARASREHPAILEMLADGRLHLSGIAKLAPHLTQENRDALLRRATHKSKREVDELVAEIAPRSDVPAVIRKLPAGRLVARPFAKRVGVGAVSPPVPQRVGVGVATGQPNVELRPERVDSGLLDTVTDPECRLATKAERSREGASLPNGASGGEAASESLSRSGADAPSPTDVRCDGGLAWVGARVRPAAIEPLAPSRYKVQFTASAELREKLQRLQALMRSSVPDGDLAAVIEAAVTEKLERLVARRFGRTRSPRKTVSKSDTSPRTRHVPAAIKRAVSERDEGRCRYVDADGHAATTPSTTSPCSVRYAARGISGIMPTGGLCRVGS
jgi:hypothetical protein